MLSLPVKLSLAAAAVLTAAAPVEERLVLDPYSPFPIKCPSTPLVRPAHGVNAKEAAYISKRKVKADASLKKWLKKQGSFSCENLPSVALISSGGGLRALLETAGVHQALDERDSDAQVAGLYQALSYDIGLSGGAWFQTSLAGNNWPTISQLRDNLWYDGFQNTLLVPANLLSAKGLTEYGAVAADVSAKELAGYQTSIVDPYGRLLSYQLLNGFDGGAAKRLSGLTTFSNFTDHSVPYPIMTALGVDGTHGMCIPTPNATQYEFHPYEYGSWDAGVSAFADTQYMGSALTNGKPSLPGVCTANYDNIGYVMGTSSDVFFAACTAIPGSNSSAAPLASVLSGLVEHSPVLEDLYAIYPNPFHGYPRSSLVQEDKILTMVDGGVAGQNLPIWPLLFGGRKADVLVMSDNSFDTDEMWPNGTEIRETYERSRAAGSNRLPFIPTADVFVAEGLNKRATFFGCNEPKSAFVIYLPNNEYTFPSNQSTFKLMYTHAETDGMLSNGNAIATQNGDKEWPECFACGVMKNSGTKLPGACKKCFDKYCFRK